MLLCMVRVFGLKVGLEIMVKIVLVFGLRVIIVFCRLFSVFYVVCCMIGLIVVLIDVFLGF